MPANCTVCAAKQPHQSYVNDLGKLQLIHRAHRCACELAACYGLSGFWYCTECWVIHHG